ncbi:hypothetical protein DRQ50_05010, partial [bacterium]
GDADEAAWGAKIIREVERMEAVFRAVGDLTSGTGSDPTTRNLDAVLEEVVAEAAIRHPELIVRVTGAVPLSTRLPAADLRLILRELLANSAEGNNGLDGAENVEISVAVEPTGYGVLRISDDGPGLEPHLEQTACDPFVTSKQDHPGVGLTRVETLMDMYGLAWHLQGSGDTGTTVTIEVTLGGQPIAQKTDLTRKAD